MSKIPKHVREEVAREVYKRASAIGWEDLTLQERTRQYEAWANDDAIGKRIAQYVSPEKVRVWIKDGPMKEYSRARRGLGAYASHMKSAKPTESVIVGRLYGDKWFVKEGSVGVKPANFVATDGSREERLFWGAPSQLKHLVWAWLVDEESAVRRIVVVGSAEAPLTVDWRRHCMSVSRRIGAEINLVEI